MENNEHEEKYTWFPTSAEFQFPTEDEEEENEDEEFKWPTPEQPPLTYQLPFGYQPSDEPFGYQPINDTYSRSPRQPEEELYPPHFSFENYTQRFVNQQPIHSPRRIQEDFSDNDFTLILENRSPIRSPRPRRTEEDLSWFPDLNFEYKMKHKYYSKQSSGKFRVQIRVNGKSCHFGTYNTEEEAQERVAQVLEDIAMGAITRCPPLNQRTKR